MKLLKLIFLPYIGLGVFTGMSINCVRTDRFRWHPGLTAFAMIAAVHVVLFCLGVWLVTKLRPKAGVAQVGLSPTAWYVGFVLTYITGLVIGLLQT